MWRRLFILVAVLGGSLVGVVIALKSERVAENLRQRVEIFAAKQLGAEVHVARLGLELLPPRVHLVGVQVIAPGETTPSLSLRRGSVGIHPWPSPAGALVIDHLQLDGLVATWPLNPALAPPPSTGGGPNVDVQELLITNANLDIALDDTKLRLEGVDVSMTAGERQGRVLHAAVTRGEAKTRDRHATFGGRVSASLVGSLDRPERLSITSSEVTVQGLEIESHGDVYLRGEPSAHLSLSAQGPLSRLHELVPQAGDLGGTLTLTATLTGTLQKPSVHGIAKIVDLRRGARRFGAVEVAAEVSRDALLIDRLHLLPPNMGELTAKGSLLFNQRLTVELSGRLEGANLPGILEAAGLPDSWVRMRYTGDVSVAGALAEPNLVIKLAGAAEELVVQGGSYKNPNAPTFLRIPELGVQLDASLTAGELGINSATLNRESTTLSALGTLSFDPSVGMDLQVSGDVSLLDLGDVAQVPLVGAGGIAAVIEGPYNDPTISATTTLKSFALLGYPVGDVQATLIYKRLELSIDRFLGTRGPGSFNGNGMLSFIKAPHLAMQAKLDGLVLADVLATAGVGAEITSRLAAIIGGNVEIDGPLNALQGTVDAHTTSLVVEGASLGEAHFVGSFGEAERLAFGELATASDAGAMLAQVTVHKDKTLTLETALDAVELSALLPLMGGADLSCTATARARLSGPANQLSGNIEVSVPALVAYKTHLGAAKIRGSVRESTMALSGSLFGGGAELSGELSLARQLPYAITAKLTRVKAQEMWPALGDISLVASGSMFSQGALTDPKSILADIELTQARAQLGALVLEASRPVHLQYAQEILTVLDLAAAGSGLTFSAAGRSWNEGTVDASLVGSGELSALKVFWPSAHFSRGKSDLRLRVSGTWADPVLDGEAVLHNGSLRLPIGQTMEQIQGRLLFAGRSIEVLGASAHLGGGNVRLGGNISLPKGESAELNLRAELSNVTLRPWQELVTTFNGQLALVGPAQDLLLRGQLDVAELRYSANVDLEKLIPKRQAPPLRVADEESEHPVRLAVSVQAPGNIWLLSSVLEAEFQADLMVAGTSERVGMLGSLLAKRGHAEFQDVRYQIERASVLFTEEYRLFTEFDVRATTNACGMDVTVELHGNSDGYNATTTGEDDAGPVPPQDVVACLYAGIRRDDGDASLQSNLGVSSIDALWAVSGVDAQVRRLFPMVDELRLSSRWSSRSKRTTPRIIIGKELGQHLKATYSRALDEADDQMVSMEYELNSVATMLGSWNSANEAQQLGDFGLDLRLRWEFQ